MNQHVAVYRDEAGPAAGAARSSAACKEEAQSAYIDDRGTVFNQDVLGAIELGYMLDCAEAIVVGARSSARSRAARSSAPTTRSATTRSGSSTSTSSLNGDGTPKVSYSPVTITQWQPEERKY